MTIAVASTSEAPVMVTLHSELQVASLIRLQTGCSEAKPICFWTTPATITGGVRQFKTEH